MTDVRVVCFSPANSVWLGIEYDVTNHVHRWLDGDVVTWTNWSPSEPDDLDDHHCVVLSRNFHYYTKKCQNKQYDTICESGRFNCIVSWIIFRQFYFIYLFRWCIFFKLILKKNFVYLLFTFTQDYLIISLTRDGPFNFVNKPVISD